MMYSFESSGSRKPLHAMVIGALVGAAVLFSLGTLPDVPLPSLFQMGAILCATLAVYLTVRSPTRQTTFIFFPVISVMTRSYCSTPSASTMVLG